MKTFSFKLLVFVFLSCNLAAQAQTFTTYTTDNGLPSNNVNGVAVDHKNVKWFGTQSGVARYNDTSWVVYTTANGLIDNYINCIAVDVNNHIWVGTDIGVSVFNGTSWTSYTPANGMLNDIVNCIAGAPNGNIWVGTSSGASKFDGSAWTNYTTSEGLSSNMINSIAVEAGGNVWFGTSLGGLCKYDGSAFKTITTADSLPNDNVMAVAIGADNTKWAGTYSGVAVFNSSDQWVKTYRQQQGILNNFIQDIDMDSKGNMWFGLYDIYTQDPGLSKLKTAGDWKSYTPANGLINAFLHEIAVDKNDDIWVATVYGVNKLKEAGEGIGNIAAFPAEIYPNPAGSFFHADGLPSSGILTVSTVAGEHVLKTQVAKGNNSVSIEGFKSGLYILRCTTDSGIYSGKLIIR